MGDLKEHPARRLDPLPVDPLRTRRQQHRQRATNIIRLPGATQCGIARDHRVQRRVVAHRTAAKVGLDGARRQYVHADLPRAQLLGLIAGQHFHCAFHRRVGGITRQAEAGQAAGDVDDAPAVIDQRQQLLRQEERPFELDIHQQVELFRGGLGERRVHTDPGVVDQEVEARTIKVLQRLLNPRSEIGKGFAATDVQLQHHGFGAALFQFSDQRLGFIGAAVVGADDVHAFGGEVQGGILAQATAGAGDQCDFAAHVKSSIAVSGDEQSLFIRHGVINRLKAESLVGSVEQSTGVLMNKLELLRTFVRVSELSSFTLAGESLGLPRSTVSEHVQALETLLGTRLLQRTTRKVQATQDGLVLYERSKDLLSHMDEIEGLFRQDPASLSGRIRVDMPNILARRLIMPLLPEFMARHPNLELEISSTDRRVDLLSEGFDCVVRIGAQPDQSVVARHLGDFPMINCASPAYLERYGVPQTLEDLAQHRLVHYVGVLGSRSEGFVFEQDGQVRRLPMAGSVTVNSTDAYESACLGGFGLIQVPRTGMQPHLDTGELLTVLPQFTAPAMAISILYARQRHLPLRVRVFMEWLGDVIRSTL